MFFIYISSIYHESLDYQVILDGTILGMSLNCFDVISSLTAFIAQNPSPGILLTLAFSCEILWQITASVLEHLSKKNTQDR